VAELCEQAPPDASAETTPIPAFAPWQAAPSWATLRHLLRYRFEPMRSPTGFTVDAAPAGSRQADAVRCRARQNKEALAGCNDVAALKAWIVHGPLIRSFGVFLIGWRRIRRLPAGVRDEFLRPAPGARAAATARR
jgi:hypothetical protein